MSEDINLIRFDWFDLLDDANQKLVRGVVDEFKAKINSPDCSGCYDAAVNRLMMIGLTEDNSYKLLQTVVLEEIFEEGMKQNEPANDA